MEVKQDARYYCWVFENYVAFVVKNILLKQLRGLIKNLSDSAI